jgi:hypothetical protein
MNGESVESLGLQVPGHTHSAGPDLDNKHQGAYEKGPTETVFPKDPQEEQSSGENADDLLSLHH